MRTYFSCIIERTFPSGYWTSLTPAGRLKADTLAGLKQMIRQAVKSKRTVIIDS